VGITYTNKNVKEKQVEMHSSWSSSWLLDGSVVIRSPEKISNNF